MALKHRIESRQGAVLRWERALFWLCWACLVGVAAFVVSTSARAQASAPAAAQTTTALGVTIKVTPKTLAAGAADWEFSVTLDTHSGSLDDDLAKTSVLVVNGKEIAPIAWSSPGAGGHHREGVLRFAVPAATSSSIELRILKAGESEPRIYQ
jgi:hypothetical protein